MSKKEEFRVVTAAVIFNDKGEFLMAKRHPQDDNLPDFWSIPAGHVEVAENGFDTLEENLAREVKEEIGVAVTVKGYLDSHSWVATTYKKITIVFLCKIINGTPQARDETIEVKWLKLPEISKLHLPPNVLRVVTKANNLLFAH